MVLLALLEHLDEFGGMMQFRPTMNISASSTGNAIVAQSVLASDLNANPNNYESEYVRIYEFAIIDATDKPNLGCRNRVSNEHSKWRVISLGRLSLMQTTSMQMCQQVVHHSSRWYYYRT